jgi:hypothetical protein
MSELAKRVFWKCELCLIEYSRLKTFEYMYKRQLHGVLVLQIFQSRVEAFAFPPSSSAEHMLNSTLVLNCCMAWSIGATLSGDKRKTDEVKYPSRALPTAVSVSAVPSRRPALGLGGT